MISIGQESNAEAKDSTAYKGRVFPAPSLTYQPETSFVIGAFLLWQFKVPGAGLDTRSSNATAWTAISLKKQFFFELRHTIFTNHEKYYLSGNIFSQFFSEKYFGIGSETKEEDALSVKYNSHDFKQRVLRKIKPFMFIGPQYRLVVTNNVEFKDSTETVVELPDVIGSEGSTESGLGLSYLWDKRNSILTPTKDFYLDFTMMFYGTYLGGDNNFSTYTLDGRKYIDFKTEGKHVLAFHALIRMTAGDVPFRELGLIGGRLINRGYLRGRYRDKTAIQFQTEYRVNLIGRFGAVVFGAIGQVNNDISNTFSNLIYSGGIGARFNINKRDPANIRVDVGFTEEGPGFYIGFGETF